MEMATASLHQIASSSLSSSRALALPKVEGKVEGLRSLSTSSSTSVVRPWWRRAGGIPLRAVSSRPAFVASRGKFYLLAQAVSTTPETEAEAAAESSIDRMKADDEDVPTPIKTKKLTKQVKHIINKRKPGDVVQLTVTAPAAAEQAIAGPSFGNSKLTHDANSSIWGVHSCGSRISDSVVCQAAPGSGPFPAGRRKLQSCNVVAAAHHYEYRNSKGPIFGNLEQGNVCARDALEGKVGEVSVSREETSGAIDRQTTVSGYEGALTSTLVLDREPITGGAFDFRGATLPLTKKPLIATKKIVLVRHGLSAWNAESRIQGSSDLSALSEEGIAQALRCKQALTNLKFTSCFASPISRAKTSAEVMWSGREEPLVFLDSLKEANLFFLEGMRNVDAKEQFPEVYRTWREDPVNFQVDGVYPVVNLWAQAKHAWQEILSTEGDLVLVVTHKSILRALMCTALGMGPDRFRAMDINNGGITVFSVNTTGEPLLQCLNMTAHLHVDGVFY